MKWPWSRQEPPEPRRVRVENSLKEMKIEEEKQRLQRERQETLRQVPPSDNDEVKQYLKIIDFFRKTLGENFSEGDIVRFKLGDVKGQVVEGISKQQYEWYASMLDDTYWSKTYPVGSLGYLRNVASDLQNNLQNLHNIHYSIRLPNGALIRELKAWELEKL
ncbi:MAG: hypothetical protein HY459_04985 [Parcubacteria group bacterium]|nr:hypothetical protein [Parcubacteria group bacterium]